MRNYITGRWRQIQSKSLIFFASGLLFMSASCSKSDNNGCTASAQVVSVAAARYAAAQSVANCQLYKATIQEYLDSECGSTLSSTDRQSFQNIINNLPC